MKRILPFLAVLLVLPAIASAETFRVTQGGGSGSMSLDEFNQLSGDYSGDTFFFSGAFLSTIEVGISGTQGNPVILDGYEPDDTRFMNLNEDSGRAKSSGVSGDGISVDGSSYAIVQDFEITDSSNGGISVSGTSHDVIVRRNYVHTKIGGGLYVGYDDPVYPYNVIFGGAPGQGNVVKDVGTGTADEDIGICNAHDVIISYNHLYATDPNYGIDGIVITCWWEYTYDILVEHNSIHDHNKITDYIDPGEYGEDGIDMKGDVHHIIIRYNKIYNHYRRANDYQDSDGVFGININSGGNNLYIYGNWFENNQAAGVYFSSRDDHVDTYVFSNIFVENQMNGLSNSAAYSGSTHYVCSTTIS